MSKPRMDVTIIIPTKMKEMCWDQNFTWEREKEFKNKINKLGLRTEDENCEPTLFGYVFKCKLKHTVIFRVKVEKKWKKNQMSIKVGKDWMRSWPGAAEKAAQSW